MTPYNVQLVQELKPTDHHYAPSGPAIDLQKMRILEKKNIFADEAHFELGGYVNKEICRIWSTENPHAYIEKPTH